MSNQPMIYTSKGNLPVADLVYEPKWEEADEYIKFSETWSLDGEVVKENAHVYKKRGFFSEAIAHTV